MGFKHSPANLLRSDSLLWSSFTPGWHAASVDPAIGDGTIGGRYVVIGDLVVCQIEIVMGSTTTFGTGEWYVGLPVTAADADMVVGSAAGLDNGTGVFGGIATNLDAGADADYVVVAAPDGSGNWSATQPFTWTNGDRLVIGVAYENSAPGS